MIEYDFNEKIFKIGNIFYLCRFKGGFWFRFLRRYGVHGKNTKIHELVFSEKYLLGKRLKIGNWIFKILKP